MTSAYFCGSYLPTDVRFLLTVMDKKEVLDVDPATKEQLIQTGQRHYSQMLSMERLPDETHVKLYMKARHQYTHRYAQAIHHLAYGIHQAFLDTATPIVLVSLVRAGVPVGVLLKRAFDDVAPYHRASVHYGVSIIKGKGIDHQALAHIITCHPTSPIVFVDGWTGKGAIFDELVQSVRTFCQAYPASHAQFFDQDMPRLVVLSDPAGVAWLSASEVDWLMPSSLLNSTISGLISRTLWRDEGYHGVVYHDEFAKHDESVAFVERIDEARRYQSMHRPDVIYHTTPRHITTPLITMLATEFGIDDHHRIKPTLAEATRAVIRRDPSMVLLHEDHEDNALIRHLCQQKNIPIMYRDIFPYQAITFIKKRQ